MHFVPNYITPLQIILYVIYYLNIKKYREESITLIKKETKNTHCPYCKGEGYFQLRLGGSETCNCCNGSGRKWRKYDKKV